MYESTLILLAGGGSRAHVVTAIAAHPEARVWTLNAMRHERAELQFEIHAPAPINETDPRLPAIVSADYRREADSASRIPDLAPRIPFPLEAACTLGAPFFELSHDYMLAYAALLHAGVMPDEALPPGISVRPFRQIILCGVDCDDTHHFARSRGVHFWYGLLRGLGVAMTVMEESTLLAGGVLRDVVEMTPLQRPFFYGQIRDKRAER